MKWPVDVRIVSQSDFVMFIPRLKIQGKIHHMQFIYWMHPTVRTINNASFMMMCYAQFIQNVLSRRWIVRVREEESVRMRKNRAEEKSFLRLRFCLLFYPIVPAMVYVCVGLLQTACCKDIIILRALGFSIFILFQAYYYYSRQLIFHFGIHARNATLQINGGEVGVYALFPCSFIAIVAQGSNFVHSTNEHILHSMHKYSTCRIDAFRREGSTEQHENKFIDNAES